MHDSVSISELGASRSDQLQRVMDAGLVKQGRVFTLSLSAIQNQLGARWAARSDQVWDAVHRALVKRMPPPDIFLKLDETTVLAAIASTDAYEGQVRCAEVLRSILVFFLGRAAEEDLNISRVSGLQDGRLSCEALDMTAPPPPSRASLEPRVFGPAARAHPAQQWSPPLAGRRYMTPFLSSRGVSVPMLIEVAPVWRLDQDVVSAYALRRRIGCRQSQLTDDDREAMGHVMLDHLVPLLEEYRREGGVFALLVPSFFSNASATRPRLNILGRCAGVMDVMRQVVVLEIEGIEPGVPAGRVAETAAMMRPFANALTVSVRSAAEAQAAVREYAFDGMALDAGKVPEAQLDAVIRTARRRTPNVVVHGARRGDEARLRGLGASHMSFREDLAPAQTIRREAAARTSPETSTDSAAR